MQFRSPGDENSEMSDHSNRLDVGDGLTRVVTDELGVFKNYEELKAETKVSHGPFQYL